MNTPKLLHATCVAVGGKGVLLLGDSGSGKSDLALRLIDEGALLVADDQVSIRRVQKRLRASPPQKLAGMIEARGVGILTLPYRRQVTLKLAVRLVGRPEVERMPESEVFDCLGSTLPLLSLYGFECSTCAKIRLFLKTL